MTVARRALASIFAVVAAFAMTPELARADVIEPSVAVCRDLPTGMSCIVDGRLGACEPSSCGRATPGGGGSTECARCVPGAVPTGELACCACALSVLGLGAGVVVLVRRRRRTDRAG